MLINLFFFLGNLFYYGGGSLSQQLRRDGGHYVYSPITCSPEKLLYDYSPPTSHHILMRMLKGANRLPQ